MLVSKDVEFSQERFTAFRQQPSVQKQQIHVLEQVCSAKGTRWRPEYESWGTEREREIRTGKTPITVVTTQARPIQDFEMQPAFAACDRDAGGPAFLQAALAWGWQAA
jgi:hypothetical protein